MIYSSGGGINAFISGINGGGTTGGALGSDTIVAVVSAGKLVSGTRFVGIVKLGSLVVSGGLSSMPV